VEASPPAAHAVTEPLAAAGRAIDAARRAAPLSAEARDRARDHARGLAGVGGPGGAAFGVLIGVAELLAEVMPELGGHPEACGEMIARLSRDTDLPALLIARQLIGGGRLLSLPPADGLDATLTLLAAVAGSPSLSVWTTATATTLRCLAQIGVLSSRVAEDVARHGLTNLAGESPGVPAPLGDGWFIWSLPPVGRIDGPVGVLVAMAPPGATPTLESLAGAALPTLAVLAERARGDERDAISGAVQRRLARLRFDLHDGPQQDVVLLAQDLRLFRDQLRPMVADDPDRDRVVGRLDDLEAQLVALDGDLRRLSTAVQSPFLASGTLDEALTEISLAFAQRTGIEPATRLGGDLGALTESQQITVLALVREALSNVRKHSDAEHVSITVAADPAGVAVEVADDGSGFDTETALGRAARTGHLGLVGMHERVRMLGGRTQIVSRPGGPTVISAVLPPVNGGEEAAG
jgi:signal transduction histidine kinase